MGNPGKILRLNFDVVVKYNIKNFVIEKFNLLRGIDISMVVYPSLLLFWSSHHCWHNYNVKSITALVIASLLAQL